jgi:hypothetical protein
MSEYDRGRWDMFVEITSIEYGKQCYFMQDNGLVYSRRSCNYMTVDQAVTEFLRVLEADEW